MKRKHVYALMLAGIAAGFFIGHTLPKQAHSWMRQSFSDQQTIVLVSLLMMVVYAHRLVYQKPVSARDARWTQRGAILFFGSFAWDKQFWSVVTSLYIANGINDPAYLYVRYDLAFLQTLGVIGMFTGCAMMAYPWTDRILGENLWWLPWAMVPAIWMVIFKISGAL
jgi:hypothetical protein